MNIQKAKCTELQIRKNKFIGGTGNIMAKIQIMWQQPFMWSVGN